MVVGDVYTALETALRSLDDALTWAAIVDRRLAAAGKSGRLLTEAERTAMGHIRGRWAAYQARIDVLMAESMPDVEP